MRYYWINCLNDFEELHRATVQIKTLDIVSGKNYLMAAMDYFSKSLEVVARHTIVFYREAWSWAAHGLRTEFRIWDVEGTHEISRYQEDKNCTTPSTDSGGESHTSTIKITCHIWRSDNAIKACLYSYVSYRSLQHKEMVYPPTMLLTWREIVIPILSEGFWRTTGEVWWVRQK